MEGVSILLLHPRASVSRLTSILLAQCPSLPGSHPYLVGPQLQHGELRAGLQALHAGDLVVGEEEVAQGGAGGQGGEGLRARDVVVGEVQECEGGEGDEGRDGVQEIVAEDQLLGGGGERRGDEWNGKAGRERMGVTEGQGLTESDSVVVTEANMLFPGGACSGI